MDSNAHMLWANKRKDRSYTTYIHGASRFLEVLNGGALYPDCNLALKAAESYAALALGARREKMRGHYAQRSGVSHGFSGFKRLRPQQHTGAKRNGISRETAIAPARWKAKVAAGKRTIYAGPKVSCSADNGVHEIARSPLPCKSEALPLPSLTGIAAL